MENYENNNEMVNVEEQTYDAPEEEKSSNGIGLLVGIGAGCALLGYGAKTLVEAVKRRAKAKKEGSEEDKPKKEKKGFKLFGKKDKSEKKETKETEKADEAKAEKEES